MESGEGYKMNEYLPAMVAGVCSLVGAGGPIAVYAWRLKIVEKTAATNQKRIKQLEHGAIKSGWNIKLVG
jgi:hypothetical protein